MTDSAGSFLFELDMMFEEGSAQTCLFPLLSEIDYLQLADLPLSFAVRRRIHETDSGSAVAGVSTSSCTREIW